MNYKTILTNAFTAELADHIHMDSDNVKSSYKKLVS